jgi:hypothetical protein
MNALIQNMGVPWAYRILGLTTLATGLPAAWFLKERVPTHTPRMVEWYVPWEDLGVKILTDVGLCSSH